MWELDPSNSTRPGDGGDLRDIQTKWSGRRLGKLKIGQSIQQEWDGCRRWVCLTILSKRTYPTTVVSCVKEQKLKPVHFGNLSKRVENGQTSTTAVDAASSPQMREVAGSGCRRQNHARRPPAFSESLLEHVVGTLLQCWTPGQCTCWAQCQPSLSRTLCCFRDSIAGAASELRSSSCQEPQRFMDSHVR